MKAIKLVLLATALSFQAKAQLKKSSTNSSNYKMQSSTIQSRWAKEVSPENALKEYPRPQMVRRAWINLNGLWSYAITEKDAATPTVWDGEILVPYPLESALSGVKRALLPAQNLWYKRTFVKPSVNSGEKVMINFGAVDYRATVFVNGRRVGEHEGGYTAFSLDISSNLKDGENEVIVKVFDPTGDGIGPHGKQVLNPANIYYTSTSGIWQTVWLETVPTASINSLTITPDIDKSIVNITVNSDSKSAVQLEVEGKFIKGTSNRIIAVPVKNAKLWSPTSPFLYDFSAKLGKDIVKSYFGMRKISVAKDEKGVDRIMLNNKPYYNLGTLDQGFWPEGLYTAPTDEALAFDIKAIKAMGFNTIRKHIKVEPARWYFHADKIGMLVWQDMVNPNQNLQEGSKAAFEKGSTEIITQLYNYPSIITWVLFNEKWGQYDQERLTKWIKESDPSRLINGHSGELLYVNDKLRSPSPNAYVGADMTDVHAYPDPMNALAIAGKARVLGEFGGIGVFIPDHQWLPGSAWGYIQEKPAALLAKYSVMNKHLQLFKNEGLSASIYTQPFDVEGEQNGLMTYDREVVKIPFAELRKIHLALNPDMGTIPDITAGDANLTEPATVYASLFEQYMAGNRESGIVKRLALMAGQTGDIAGKARFGAEYIASLKAPFNDDEINFIESNTKSVSDEGFNILRGRLAILKGSERRTLYVKLMNIVYSDVIAPFVPTPQAMPDWNELALKIKAYGDFGEEMLLRAKTIHMYNQQDWANYRPAALEYLSKYGANIKESDKAIFEKAINEHQ